MQEYEHIPYRVEAVVLSDENAESVAEWCGGRVIREETLDGEQQLGVNFPTIDGTKRLSRGQVLVRNKSGSFVAHNKGFFDTMFTRKEADKPEVPSHTSIASRRRI